MPIILELCCGWKSISTVFVSEHHWQSATLDVPPKFKSTILADMHDTMGLPLLLPDTPSPRRHLGLAPLPPLPRSAPRWLRIYRARWRGGNFNFNFNYRKLLSKGS